MWGYPSSLGWMGLAGTGQAQAVVLVQVQALALAVQALV
jgi:hypothetical protein